MKTELDFSRVPLDKWVDLYNASGRSPDSITYKAYSDVNKYAEVQVKEQSDYDKDLADACTEWFANSTTESFVKIQETIKLRTLASPKEVKEETIARSPVDLSNIPF